MKLGFASAILPDQSFDTVVSFAAEHGYRGVEMMSWPAGKAERRYAGVTHIDVDTLDAARVDAIKAKLSETGVEISALGYYPNALDPDAEKAQVAINHIKKLIALYRERRDMMLRSMEKAFPEEVTFTRPAGGLFTWVTLPEKVNARDLFLKALEKKVAFVPGGAFFPNGGHENTLRLNYSNMPPELIEEGIASLGEALREFL